MLNIEFDGFYCKECNDFHPTMFWHEAYDDYLKTKDDAIPYYKKAVARFGENINDEEALAFYFENMRIKGIEYSNELGECVICQNETHYLLSETKEFVCSDKCKYQGE